MRHVIDWQQQAIDYIQKNAHHLYIASPKKKYLGDSFQYNEQVDWESHFLQRAASNGCVLFFLANEAEQIAGRAYAQTTRFELGEWAAKQAQNNCNMVVGIEAGFSNAKYIKRRLGQNNPNVPILDDLVATCQTAIHLLAD